MSGRTKRRTNDIKMDKQRFSNAAYAGKQNVIFQSF